MPHWIMRAHPKEPTRALIALGLVAALLGCSDKDKNDGPAKPEEKVHGLTKEQAAQPLVTIGDTVVTAGEFAARLAEQSPYLRARYNTPERRREFLDNMVRFELLALEAKRRGLEKLDEVDRTKKQVMIQQMMKEKFEEKIKPSDITEEEIRAYYESHKDEFNKPEQVRASHILIKDRAKAQRVLRQVLESQDDVNVFRDAAGTHNEDAETKERFGDLRFFSRPAERSEDEPNIPKEVAEAAFSIERVGGIHPELVKTDAGFHIVKLTGRRAALNRPLDEARRPIQNRLWREKREKAVDDFVEKLRKEAKVEENYAALDQVRIELPEGPIETDGPGAGGAGMDQGADEHAGHGH